MELKEIAPYLPFKPLVQFKGSPNKDHYNHIGIYSVFCDGDCNYKEWEDGLILKYGYIRKITIRKGYSIFRIGKRATFTKSCFADDFKLCARPLSDLTKPCMKDDKIPIVELGRLYFRIPDNIDIFLSSGKNSAMICNNKFEYYKGAFWVNDDGCLDQIQLFNWLYEHHFWLGDQSRFGKDIIDINSIQ